MKTLRVILYKEIFTAVTFIALGFLGLFSFFDLVDQLPSLGRLNPLDANLCTHRYYFGPHASGAKLRVHHLASQWPWTVDGAAGHAVLGLGFCSFYVHHGRLHRTVHQQAANLAEGALRWQC